MVRIHPGVELPSAPDTSEALVMAAVIVDERGRAFVQRRSPQRRLFPGCWDLVGGHVEAGEDPVESLAREVQEETGWRLTDVVALLQRFSWTGSDGRTRQEYDYLVRVSGDLSAPDLEWDKHPEYAWVTEAELPMLMDNRDPDDRAIYSAVAPAVSAA